MDTNGVTEDDLAFFKRQLGGSETDRLLSFVRPERRRQFLLGRILLRFAVSHLTGLPVDAIGVVERPDNAPRLVFPDAQHLKPNFSLSHSRNWVACVVSCAVTLGLDIEVNDPARDIDEMSEIVFHPNARLRLSALSRAERVASFYDLWCEKEALHKLLCNLGRESDSAALLGSHLGLQLEKFGWHRYEVPFPGLSMIIESDHPLLAISERILAGFARADWLAAVQDSAQTKRYSPFDGGEPF
jgi:4'-phosphopantetheinyl transferase